MPLASIQACYHPPALPFSTPARNSRVIPTAGRNPGPCSQKSTVTIRQPCTSAANPVTTSHAKTLKRQNAKTSNPLFIAPILCIPNLLKKTHDPPQMLPTIYGGVSCEHPKDILKTS